MPGETGDRFDVRQRKEQAVLEEQDLLGPKLRGARIDEVLVFDRRLSLDITTKDGRAMKLTIESPVIDPDEEPGMVENAPSRVGGRFLLEEKSK